MEDAPVINTKSRIGRGLSDRKNTLGNTGGAIIGNSNGFSQNNNAGIKNIGGDGPFIPRNRVSIPNNATNISGDYSNGLFGSSQQQQNNNNNFGRKPLIPESQIDRHTENLTKEIESLDLKLNNNSNNNVSKGGFGIQNHNSNNNMNIVSHNQNGGIIRRQRGDSKQQEENITNFTNTNTNSNSNFENVKRQTGNSFNGRSTNTSMNNTFKQDQLGGTNHFEQKEKELKMQLQQIEKQKEQKEKIQKLQENAMKNTNAKGNSDDLLLKLSSPTFNSKKSNTISQNQQKTGQTPNNFGSSNTSLNKNGTGVFGSSQNNFNNNDMGDSEYVPGSYKPGGALGRTGGLTQKNKEQNKPAPKNIDSEIAVATGFQDAPFEDSQQDTSELILCPEGCGRQFHEKALVKHIPICKKVFQDKRQSFNVAKQRQIDEDQAKLARQGKIKEKINKKQTQKTRDTSAGKPNLAELKKQMKQKKEQQGGQVDLLLNE